MADVADCVRPSAWGGNKIDNCVEQLAYAEVGKRRTKKCWGGLSTNKQFDVEIGTNFIEQRDAIKGGLPRIALIDCCLRRVNNLCGCAYNCISSATSRLGRSQFSSENAYSVSASTPRRARWASAP